MEGSPVHTRLTGQQKQLHRIMAVVGRALAEATVTPGPAASDEPYQRLRRAADALDAVTTVDTRSDEATRPKSDGLTEGIDDTGAVLIVSRRDGLPMSVELSDDWRRRVGAAGLAAAVTQACLRATSDPTPDDHHDRPSDDLTDKLEQVASFLEEGGPLGSASVPDPDPSSPFASPDRLLERVLLFTETYNRSPSESDPSSADPSTEQLTPYRIEVAISPAGLVSCTADPVWVGRQDASDLTEALERQFALIRTEHTGRSAPNTLTTARIDQQVSEVTAVFTELRRQFG